MDVTISSLFLGSGRISTVASGFALFGSYGVSATAVSQWIALNVSLFLLTECDNKTTRGVENNFVNISLTRLSSFALPPLATMPILVVPSGATVSVRIKVELKLSTV